MTAPPIAAASAALVLLASGSTAPGPIILDKAIESAYSSLQETLTKTRTPLKLVSGKRVQNCNQYLNEVKAGAVSSSVHRNAVYSEYVICDLVSTIDESNRLRLSKAENRPFGQTLASRLDLRSFESSLGPRITDSQFTLKGLDPDGLQVKNHSASISSSGWHFEVRLVAIVDINGNGKPDWLLRVTDEAKQGTYRAYQVLLAKDVPDEGMIKVDN